jgi:hypothetical protein
MAFSASQLNIAVNFDLTNSPKNFTLTDTTVYTGETYTNVLGNLLALKPGGATIRNNTSYVTPDIDLSVSPNSAVLGNLPLNTGLTTVVEGVYSFTYTVKFLDLLQSYTIVSNNSAAKTFTVNGNIAALILDASATNYNCVDSTTTALTIVSATYSAITGLTTVTVNETLGSLTNMAEFQFTVNQIFSKIFTQDYSYASPSVCLNWVTDECCSSMTITDVTVYEAGSTVTRLHTISYPIGISPAKADIESPLQEVNITPIWTGTWVDIFTADITAANGIILITDSIRGIKDHKVSSDDGLCQVYTCLSNMATKYTSYLTSAPQRALEMQKYISQASAAFMAYTVGKKCAEANYEQYLTLITDIADECGCGCDCADCADGVPTQVVGCCENVGGSDYIILINPLDASVNITFNTIGDTTTFTIGVDASWLDTQIVNKLDDSSINVLGDVDTTNIASATGQVLVWNQGLGLWQRGTSQASLINLTDVDDTGLSNNMILYYDGGSSTFKFKTSITSIANCVDVDLTLLATDDTLVYNGTDWENQPFILSNLKDVISGFSVGDSIVWNGANWVAYSTGTGTSLDDLTDVILSPLNDYDRFAYRPGLLWHNVPLPTFTNAGSTWQLPPVAGTAFAPVVAGYEDFEFAQDDITGEITIRGAIKNNAIASIGSSPVSIVVLPSTFAPKAGITVPFTCIVGAGISPTIAIGSINGTSGLLTIDSFMSTSTGLFVSGLPAGDILISTPIKYYKNI